MHRITSLYIVFIFVSALNSPIIANTTSTKSESSNATVQRVRIDFISPTGYTRHLLLGFTSDGSATDGVDYGYDGPNIEDLDNDLNWIIEGGRYIIQGVGPFDINSRYPLGLFLNDSGNIEIALTALENFDNPIDVFVYDQWEDSYTKINDGNYIAYMASGDFMDRFYIAFTEEESERLLNLDEIQISGPVTRYLIQSKELHIHTFGTSILKKIQVFNLMGQKIYEMNNMNLDEITIPASHISSNYVIARIETDEGSFNKKILVH
jgi:hypothetical protein